MTGLPDPRAGVFDTLLVQGGAAVAQAAHLRRLAASVRELYGETPDQRALADEVAHAAASGAVLQRVRVGYVPGAGVSVETHPLAARPRGPLQLVVRRVPGGWGRHKWCDRSLLEAGRGPADPSTDLLLVDEDDQLLETGRGNVFVVDDDGAATPPLDGRILPGTTRETVLGLDLGARPRSLSLAALAAAGEVFVTSSIGGVRPVASCDLAGEWATGPVTRAVDAALERVWAEHRDAP